MEGVRSADASVCWTSLVIAMVVTVPVSGQNVQKLIQNVQMLTLSPNLNEWL